MQTTRKYNIRCLVPTQGDLQALRTITHYIILLLECCASFHWKRSRTLHEYYFEIPAFACCYSYVRHLFQIFFKIVYHLIFFAPLASHFSGCFPHCFREKWALPLFEEALKLENNWLCLTFYNGNSWHKVLYI